MKTCPKCHTENADTQQTCRGCGHELIFESGGIAVSRRSAWATAIRIVGWIHVLAAVVLLVRVLTILPHYSENPTLVGLDLLYPVAFFFFAAYGAVGAFFGAFLLDVFTDIRWYLQQIAGRSLTPPSGNQATKNDNPVGVADS